VGRRRVDRLADQAVLEEGFTEVADIVGDNLGARRRERGDAVGKVGFASTAVWKARLAPGATSCTICNIARPSSP